MLCLTRQRIFASRRRNRSSPPATSATSSSPPGCGEALSRTNGARVVSVSSLGHRYSPVVFDDPNLERREYNPWAAYGQSKTANIIFAVEPDQRGRDAGVRAFSLQIGETSVADGAHMRGVMPYAVDPKGAEQLWTLSERLLDLKFL